MYNALLEALRSGNTVIPCSKFKEAYEDLCRVDPVKDTSLLEEQFEVRLNLSYLTQRGLELEHLCVLRFSSHLDVMYGLSASDFSG